MANHASALKRHRQNQKLREHNRYFKSTLRTTIKKFLASITEGKKETAGPALKAAVSLVDSVARKGIIPRNTAARRVSQLVRKFNQTFTA